MNNAYRTVAKLFTGERENTKLRLFAVGSDGQGSRRK